MCVRCVFTRPVCASACKAIAAEPSARRRNVSYISRQLSKVSDSAKQRVFFFFFNTGPFQPPAAPLRLVPSSHVQVIPVARSSQAAVIDGVPGFGYKARLKSLPGSGNSLRAVCSPGVSCWGLFKRPQILLSRSVRRADLVRRLRASWASAESAPRPCGFAPAAARSSCGIASSPCSIIDKDPT